MAVGTARAMALWRSTRTELLSTRRPARFWLALPTPSPIPATQQDNNGHGDPVRGRNGRRAHRPEQQLHEQNGGLDEGQPSRSPDRSERSDRIHAEASSGKHLAGWQSDLVHIQRRRIVHSRGIGCRGVSSPVSRGELAKYSERIGHAHTDVSLGQQPSRDRAGCAGQSHHTLRLPLGDRRRYDFPHGARNFDTAQHADAGDQLPLQLHAGRCQRLRWSDQLRTRTERRRRSDSATQALANEVRPERAQLESGKYYYVSILPGDGGDAAIAGAGGAVSGIFVSLHRGTGNQAQRRIVTATTDGSVPLKVGNAVVIAGVTPAVYDGSFLVTSVTGDEHLYLSTCGRITHLKFRTSRMGALPASSTPQWIAPLVLRDRAWIRTPASAVTSWAVRP